jgi:hypothetical protein
MPGRVWRLEITKEDNGDEGPVLCVARGVLNFQMKDGVLVTHQRVFEERRTRIFVNVLEMKVTSYEV